MHLHRPLLRHPSARRLFAPSSLRSVSSSPAQCLPNRPAPIALHSGLPTSARCHRLINTEGLATPSSFFARGRTHQPRQHYHQSEQRFQIASKKVDGLKSPVIAWTDRGKMSPSSQETGDGNDTYSRVFNNNSTWRRSLAETDPELFQKLGKGQSPQILWIGCADSRCPETTILGLQPGEIFCHRNIANILVPTDLNSLSVIQYAVQYLKVKHIIICGHTSCGGIAAALDNKKLGLIDTWLMPLRTLRRENLALLEKLDEKERGLKMVELNVRSGVNVLLDNPTVIDAMTQRNLQVHGLIYDVGTGELRELDIGEDDQVVNSRVTAFKTE